MWQKRFWLGIIGMCTVIACGFALGLALISASAALAFASYPDTGELPATQQEAGPQPRVLNGVVTDSSCHAKHATTGKSAAECARECVSKGASYVLVAGEGVYRLEGNTSEVDRVAGQRVQVVGILDGRVLTVSSVTIAQ
jgi:hypothetical protein